MRVVESLVMGLVLSVLAIGLSVTLLGSPWFTHALSLRYSLWEDAGLTQAHMTEIAEEVRAFVIDGAGELPEIVDGRTGFGADAVSHLADVAAVMNRATLLTWVSGLLAAAWAVARLIGRRFDRLRDGLRVGSLLTLLAVLVTVLAGTADFNSFFSAFHGLFFAAGTWTFPADSLLIQLFPEPFWAASAGAWAALSVLFAGVMWLLGVGAGRAARRLKA